MKPRHFLTLLDASPVELRKILGRAREMKANWQKGVRPKLLENRILALLFEKPSTRTRLSFETGMLHLGGNALFLSASELQVGRGESPEDTARVFSRMVDAVVLRTIDHSFLERFAAVSSVPVINGLTERAHPCQLLADIQTYEEHRGDIQGRTVAWIGDGNNVCRSYINAARQFGFALRIACPEGHAPEISAADNQVQLFQDPAEAAAGAHLLVTDVWASMGQEKERKAKQQAFANYQLNRALLKQAAPDALYLHCLPAYREQEISAELLDAPGTAIWDAAENRLHAQKALLVFLLGR